MKIAYPIFCCFVFCSIPVLSLTFDLEDRNTYDTDKRLFHIERSKNKNIVCYDINQGIKGEPDDKAPLTVYWVNQEERPGQHDALNYIQQKMAFGYTVINKHNGVITIELNAIKKRELVIEWDGRKYLCRTEINKLSSVLSKIYVKTKDSNSLQVEYVDVYGYSPDTGALVSERIYH